MASHWSFGHLKLKLWAKERPRVKLAIWLPTTKSRESTSSWHPIWECNMELKISQRGLQLWFRACCDRTLQSRVMSSQSSWSLIGTISGLHFGSPKNLCHLDVASTASCRDSIWGKVVASPESGPWWVLCVKVPVVCPNTQGWSRMLTNLFWLVFGCKFTQHKLVPLPSLIPGLPTRPSIPF
jgi:hypothetical protein